jgi:hypothetical protein
LKNGLAKVAEGITTIAELRQMSGGALTQYGAR